MSKGFGTAQDLEGFDTYSQAVWIDDTSGTAASSSVLAVSVGPFSYWRVDVEPKLDTTRGQRCQRSGRDSETFIGLSHEQATEQVQVILRCHVPPNFERWRKPPEHLSDLAVEILWLTITGFEKPHAKLADAAGLATDDDVTPAVSKSRLTTQGLGDRAGIKVVPRNPQRGHRAVEMRHRIFLDKRDRRTQPR